MNVRELLDVLGAGDLDAEVWVAVPTPKGGAIWRPLECIEDRVPEAVADKRTRCVLMGRERVTEVSA